MLGIKVICCDLESKQIELIFINIIASYLVVL